MPVMPHIISSESIDFTFNNHPPSTPEVGKKLDRVTAIMIATTRELMDLMPIESTDTEADEMFVALQQVSMWAKAGIARHQ